MSKRFKDTEVWGKEWYQKLPLKLKMLWVYMCDRCDIAGIWDTNLSLASFQIGEQISESDLSAFDGKVSILPNGDTVLIGFIEFQYGSKIGDAPMHRGILKCLALNGLSWDFDNQKIKGIDRVSIPHKDKVKDKDKEKDIPEGIEKGNENKIPEALLKIPEFTDVWKSFCEHRRKKRAPMTERTKSKILSRLEQRPNEAVAALDITMEAGWTGFDWSWVENRKNGISQNTTGRKKSDPADTEKKWGF